MALVVVNPRNLSQLQGASGGLYDLHVHDQLHLFYQQNFHFHQMLRLEYSHIGDHF